jgi:hypothetical protein
MYLPISRPISRSIYLPLSRCVYLRISRSICLRIHNLLATPFTIPVGRCLAASDAARPYSRSSKFQFVPGFPLSWLVFVGLSRHILGQRFKIAPYVFLWRYSKSFISLVDKLPLNKQRLKTRMTKCLAIKLERSNTFICKLYLTLMLLCQGPGACQQSYCRPVKHICWWSCRWVAANTYRWFMQRWEVAVRKRGTSWILWPCGNCYFPAHFRESVRCNPQFARNATKSLFNFSEVTPSENFWKLL